MKKIICFLLLFSMQLYQQELSADIVAKDDMSAPNTKREIKKFYNKLIMGKDMNFLLMDPPKINSIISKKEIITQGYDLDVINKIIDRAIVFTDGEWIDTIVALSFPNGITIYHQLSDCAWNHIWLPNGSCAFDNSSVPWMFMRPAIINDSNGYVNIREKPNIHSKIVRTIGKDELFYFTPISKEEWYPVYLEERMPFIGYIHKSRIKTFDDFPKWLKEKIKDMKGGC